MRKLRINLNFLYDHNPKVSGGCCHHRMLVHVCEWRLGGVLLGCRSSWRTSRPSFLSSAPQTTSTFSSQSSSKSSSFVVDASGRLKRHFTRTNVCPRREEDTTSSMYPRPDGSTLLPQTGGPKKVDVVCDALRRTMETLDQNRCVEHGSIQRVSVTYLINYACLRSREEM